MLSDYTGLYFLLSAIVLLGTAYFSGLAVRNYNVPVNYTRKINHFVHFLLPSMMLQFVPYDPQPKEFILTTFVFVLTFALFVKPIRSRVNFINVMFLSFDRPEDAPYTLVWVTTQIFAATLALIPIRYYSSLTGQDLLTYIPILINGFGDGLAEPIGIKFGRHKYRTKGFFVKRYYHRTLEGSLCVFIASIGAIIFIKDAFTMQQFIIALCIIPVSMTFTEAKSPHTWDAPFLYFMGGALTILIVELC